MTPALVFYAVDSWHWGDDDPRTGQWLTRFTVSLDAGSKPVSIVDRVPVARFETDIEALQFKDSVKHGQLTVMRDGWTFGDIERRRLA